MRIDTTFVTKQVDPLLQRFSQAKSRSKFDDLSDLADEEAYELIMLMSATVERLAPPSSCYVEEADHLRKAVRERRLEGLSGILRAIRSDYVAGNLQSVRELIHADIFSDFLEMADYLLDQGYKDPAAVVAGSVLEEHLRKLCDKNGIPVTQSQKPKKADSLNAELASTNSYSKLDQKSVTAWLDLRNKAAHGKYGEYSKEQVTLMVQSLRDFILRNPA